MNEVVWVVGAVYDALYLNNVKVAVSEVLSLSRLIEVVGDDPFTLRQIFVDPKWFWTNGYPIKLEDVKERE
jgi:hypothetical protein